MNSVILIGNLVADPRLQEFPPRDGQEEPRHKCSFKIAVNRNGKDAGADFVWVGVWNGSAKSCFEYLSKGSRVAVKGRISTNYDKEKDRDYFEVVADPGYGVTFLNTIANPSTQLDNDPTASAETERELVGAVAAPVSDDDIPF